MTVYIERRREDLLPVPQLDDKTFEQFVQDTGKLIRNYSPLWTDENLHDPGITFIELFSWLTEMQQFFLDQIGDKNYMKFLKLLGIKLGKAVPSIADVSFDGIGKPVIMPKGSRLLAGNIPFETDETLFLTPSRVDKVLVKTTTGTYDYTSSNYYEGICYHAFGETAEKGSRLLIGFDKKLPSNQRLDLTFDMSLAEKEYACESETDSLNVIPSSGISYQYYGTDGMKKGRKADWLPMTIIKDDTVNLLRCGKLSFKLAGEMKETSIYPANDRERFWISLVLEDEGYEFPPKIEKIKLNTVRAIQIETLCEMLSFSGTGKPGQKVIACSFLSFCGNIDVQVDEGSGKFRYWSKVNSLKSCNQDDRCYTVGLDVHHKRTSIIFGDGQNGMIPPAGVNNIRTLCCLPTFAAGAFIGKSTGLCRQTFKLPFIPVVSKSFILQTGMLEKGTKDIVWYDWEPVENFDSSGPCSRHFLLDENTGEITFGDNLQGMVPEVGLPDNIRIISYQSGGGEKGNVHKNKINELEYIFEEASGITVTNEHDAICGKEGESLEKAIIRARKELKKPFCAVTSEDYEEIVLNTPGVNVARVKALPLFAPGLKKYPEKIASAQVTLVVVPYSNLKTPFPSKGLLTTVQKHLDKHRLVTTEIHVIGPAYVKISVHAVIVGIGGNRANSGKVAEALNSMLRPLDGDDGSKGWIFGRAVYKSDIYGFIKGIEGVEFIKDLWLDAEGAEIEQKPNGDIVIPPYALVYSGQHEIEVIGNENR